MCYPAAPGWVNRFYAHFQLRAVERMLASVQLAGKRALDVGCGSGRWSRWLASRGATAIGIDPTAGMLQAARPLSPGVEFHQMSATSIDLPGESFDVVMAVTVVVPAMLAELGRGRVEAGLCLGVERGRIGLGFCRGGSGGRGLGAGHSGDADRSEATEKAQNKRTSIQSILQ